VKDKGVVFAAVTACEDRREITKAMKEGRIRVRRTRFAAEFKQVIRQGMFSKYGSQACNFCVNEAF